MFQPVLYVYSIGIDIFEITKKFKPYLEGHTPKSLYNSHPVLEAHHVHQ